MQGLAERGYFSVSENSRVAELVQMNLSFALCFHTFLLFGSDLSVLYNELCDGSVP